MTSEYIETYSSSNNKDRQYLYSSLPLDKIQRGEELTLEQDEFFLLSYNEKIIPIDMEREKLEYCRTLVYWLNWTNHTKKYNLYNDVIERSLLTLKMMTYRNEAVLAALTTSLPETVGEVRNWDYRFCWLRDASMSIETLFKVGHPLAARRFMHFIQRSFLNEHNYQIMYGIRGGWNQELQSFTQCYDNTYFDSSLLQMEPYGFITADDVRYHKTVKAVKTALLHKGLMYRYNSVDDFGLPSSAFTICVFWLIRALFVIGEKEEARSLFDEVLQYANPLGLFSEDLNFETKEQLGNFPQAYSHLALVNTALLFSEEEKRLIMG